MLFPLLLRFISERLGWPGTRIYSESGHSSVPFSSSACFVRSSALGGRRVIDKAAAPLCLDRPAWRPLLSLSHFSDAENLQSFCPVEHKQNLPDPRLEPKSSLVRKRQELMFSAYRKAVSIWDPGEDSESSYICKTLSVIF